MEKNVTIMKNERKTIMNKHSILKVLSLFIYFIALISANSPSQLGTFQKECPPKLKKR